MGLERRGCVVSPLAIGKLETGGARGRGKSRSRFETGVWEAFPHVKANQGGLAWMDSDLRSSRHPWATSYNTRNRLFVGSTFLRRCGGSISEGAWGGQRQWAPYAGG